jgi:uncharacterized membrane protein YgdD (TMEM256/DUF423 family)
MSLNNQARQSLIFGTVLLALAVLIGAFGAHGLKNLVEAEKLVTFETGVRYHFYHGFALVLLGIFTQLVPNTKAQLSHWAFTVGILLFSFNCYFYVLSGLKVFAMIVPVGGLLFVLGWSAFAISVFKSQR